MCESGRAKLPEQLGQLFNNGLGGSVSAKSQDVVDIRLAGPSGGRLFSLAPCTCRKHEHARQFCGRALPIGSYPGLFQEPYPLSFWFPGFHPHPGVPLSNWKLPLPSANLEISCYDDRSFVPLSTGLGIFSC